MPHPVVIFVILIGIVIVLSHIVLIVPVDGILTEITNDAIALVDPTVSIDLTANIWFSIGSVVMVTVVIALATEKMVEPRLGAYDGDYTLEDDGTLSLAGSRLKFALWALIGVIVFIGLLTVPARASLRDPASGAVIGNSPFMNSLIVSIALVFLACGIGYGLGAGTMRTAEYVVNAIARAIASLSGLILLLLVISRFLAHFNYSNMATLAAVSLAYVLQQADLGTIWLLLGFIVVVFILDLVITGAIPKWAIFAPIFIPILLPL